MPAPALHVVGTRPNHVSAHARMRACLQALGALDELERACVLTEPLDYLDFLCRQRSTRPVLTDSGGIQDQSTSLGIPCFTIARLVEPAERAILAA